MWHRPVIPAFKRVKEGEQESEASLGDTARPYLGGKKKTPNAFKM